MTDPERYDLSPAAAAEVLGVHPETVKRWAAAGDLPSFRTPGGHWRFRRSDLDALLPAASSPETVG